MAHKKMFILNTFSIPFIFITKFSDELLLFRL
jgi:hypothetical protein